ncbi:hypothetical protein ACLK1S_06965 [Escherichia coli]
MVCAYCALVMTCTPMVRRFHSPHRPVLDGLASNIALTAENFGDALEDRHSSRCSRRWSIAGIGSSKVSLD